MLNIASLKPRAVEQFENLFPKKLLWLAEKAWIMNIKVKLDELVEILQAAAQLEVLPKIEFSETELDELHKALVTLRTLEMNTESWNLLADFFSKKGVPETFLVRPQK